jgi:hypothetical protein
MLNNSQKIPCQKGVIGRAPEVSTKNAAKAWMNYLNKSLGLRISASYESIKIGGL